MAHDFDYRVKFFGLHRTGLRRCSRTLLACMAVAIASFGATACGSTEERPVATAVPSGQDQDGDIDSLGQGGRYDTDNDAILTWGPPADGADRAAIVALLKRYYTAAAGEGARACTMLDPLIAETVEEDRHAGRGPRLPRGSMCAQIMASMFEQRHRELVEHAQAPTQSNVAVSSASSGFISVIPLSVGRFASSPIVASIRINRDRSVKKPSCFGWSWVGLLGSQKHFAGQGLVRLLCS